MNPVSAVSLKVIAWLLSGISPGSQCPAAWQRAFSVTWWSLDISSCPGLCEEHPVVLWYTEGAYYSAVKVLWFIFSLCFCVGNALLLFSHLEIAFNACQVNQRCKYECSFTEPKQAMYLRGVTKHKSKERKIALHLSEVQDGCTGLAAAACLSTHAEGDHCVDGQTTLNGNISGLPSVWLWRCTSIYLLRLACGRPQAGKQLFCHDVSPHGENQVSPLLPKHFSCLCSPCNPSISWVTTAAPSQEPPRPSYPSTHFPMEVKPMSFDMEETMLWCRELQRRKRVSCWRQLPCSSFHKSGNSSSVNGPCGSGFCLSQEPEVDPFEE